MRIGSEGAIWRWEDWDLVCYRLRFAQYPRHRMAMLSIHSSLQGSVALNYVRESMRDPKARAKASMKVVALDPFLLSNTETHLFILGPMPFECCPDGTGLALSGFVGI